MSSIGPVARAVLTFALLGVVALVAVGAAGTLVLRRLATSQALDQARSLTAFDASIVERRLSGLGERLQRGDAEAFVAVDSVVLDAVLKPPVVRVKIWAADGDIVYSDDPRLIGEVYTLGADEREVLDEGGVTAEISDLSAPENRFERGSGELLEVYTKIETSGGTPLLFETYQRSSSVASIERDLLIRFTPVLLVALVAFAALEIPLAWVLARRLQRAQVDRERFLQRAVEASDLERSRIARDLHDGPVQELSGLAMRLAAASERTDDAAAGVELSGAAAAARGSIRTLRSAVVAVYPPNVGDTGLEPALSDLVARLEHEGIAVELDVEAGLTLEPAVAELLYRASQEALRNVVAHSGAGRVRVAVRRRGDVAILDVVDDGRGFDPADAEHARDEGHLGIRILEDVVARSGGSLSIGRGPDGGAAIHVEVPA